MTSSVHKLWRRLVTRGPGSTFEYLYYWSFIRVHRALGLGLCRRRIHDYEMLLDPRDRGISTTLLLNGDREQQVGVILRERLGRGAVVIDLGANIGYYALLERSLVGPSGKVYAIEPSPSNFVLLERNVELNRAGDVIDVFHLAGGAQAGKETFYLAEHSNLNTFVPTLSDGREAVGLTGETIEIDVVDMTSFMADKPPVDLIRMDIEGYEVEVLAGLEAAARRGDFNGDILFECHFPRYDDAQRNMRRQLRTFFELGYRPAIMTSNNETGSSFRSRGYEPRVVVKTGVENLQGLYYDVSTEDAEYFVCDSGGIRDVLLVRAHDELTATKPGDPRSVGIEE